MILSVLRGLSLVFAFAQGDAAAVQEAEMKAIQGTWQATGLEIGGQSAPADFVAKGRYVFDKDLLTIYEGEEISGKARFVLHPELNPKGIDLIAQMPENDKGKKVEGIYEIKDGSLKLCFSQEKRPTKFTSEGKAGLMTFELPKSGK
jgi:uncharacterized protein (TIGR03067 family)